MGFLQQLPRLGAVVAEVDRPQGAEVLAELVVVAVSDETSW